MRPPPIVRWTGSYGLVQADRPSTSPIATTQGVIRGFVIAVFSNVLLDWPFGAFQWHGHKRPTSERRTANLHSEDCHIATPPLCVIFGTQACGARQQHPINAISAEPVVTMAGENQPRHLGMPSLGELAEQGYGRAYWTRSQPERSRAQSKHSRKRGPRIGPRRTSAVDQLVWPETKQAQHETDRNAGPLGRNEVVKRTVCVFVTALSPSSSYQPLRSGAAFCRRRSAWRRCRTAVVYSRLGVPLKVSAVPMSRAGPIGPTH